MQDGSLDSLEVLACELHHFQSMANHDDVIASADCFLNGLLKGDLVQNGTHVEIIGHREAFEAELIPQQACADIVREAGRPAGTIWVVGGVIAVAGHHAIDLRKQCAVGQEFFLFHVGGGLGNDGQEFMRIAFGRSVAREVLGTGKDAFASHGAIEHACIGHHFLRITAITTALEGVVCGVVIRDVEHRAEIEIETEEAQKLTREFAMGLDELGVPFIAQRLCIGRFFTDEAQTGNAATLLINGDEWLDVREIAQVIDELPQLLWGFDVTTEKDVSAGLEFLETGGGFGVEGRTGNAGEEQLAEVRGVRHGDRYSKVRIRACKCGQVRLDARMVFTRILLLAALVLGLTHCTAPQSINYGQPSYGGRFMLGEDFLASRNFDLLRGKRVGLITNHTSMNGRGEQTRVMLQRALGRNLVALYAPEHGIDGTVGAGIHVSTRRDAVTGLTVYSLYGPTRKPTPSMLAPIDVLVFDLQDIGCRSYTYISTMAVAMEAAAENGKEFVVLDRPNPLGGIRVEGPPLESQWKSFVGQVPVPYVHGMTVGELALMISGERMISSVPQVRVVKMQGWQRNMVWQDTGLRWYRTSPNIPYQTSPAYYVATGILGGASAVDIGIGTDNPFGYAGGLGVNPNAMLAYCQRLNTPGVSYSTYSRKGFGGVKLNINPRANADITALDVFLLAELNRQTRGKVMSFSGSKLNLFHKVYGSESLYRDLRRGVSPSSIVASWQRHNDAFRSRRQRYLLYP